MVSRTVTSVRHLANSTELELAGTHRVSLPPFLYISEADVLIFEPGMERFDSVSKVVRGLDGRDEETMRVCPPYAVAQKVHVPPHELTVTFRERRSARDWREARALEQFHYRGHGLNKIVGRRTVLLADAGEHGIIGYGVLAATLPVAKPRFELLETTFLEQMETKLINQLVRIPRIVIHPEFRSVGLGVLMASHLVEYARTRWDIAGYRPIMVEVIASMIEHHRFFERAGFVWVGETTGKGGMIPQYGAGGFCERPNYKSYNFSIGKRQPKPYLVYPLTRDARRKVRKKSEPARRRDLPTKAAPLLKRPVVLHDVGAAYDAAKKVTRRTEEVKRSFDVDASQLRTTVLSGLCLRIDPGDVVLITGASGSGKSTLLRLLTTPRYRLRQEMRVDGSITGVRRQQVAVLGDGRRSTRALIDQVGSSVTEAIYLLNSVGLAEPHLYVKQVSEISEGQRYRFAVAKLCASKKPLWVADEFAARLDSLTAAILAKGVRKLASRFGATVVVAAAHIEHFSQSLLPNKTVYLRWGATPQVSSLRLACTQTREEVSVSVRNEGDRALHNIELALIGIGGRQRRLARIDRLQARESSQPVSVRRKRTSGWRAVAALAEGGVGDVVYFASEQPKL